MTSTNFVHIYVENVHIVIRRLVNQLTRLCRSRRLGNLQKCTNLTVRYNYFLCRTISVGKGFYPAIAVGPPTFGLLSGAVMVTAEGGASANGRIVFNEGL